MMIRHIIPVLASVVLISGAAMATTRGDPREGKSHRMQIAATTSMAEKCTALERQADTALKEHGSAKNLADAKKMRDEGSKLCASDKKADGVKKFEQALRDLGVKPQY
jgi:hypothetical protein